MTALAILVPCKAFSAGKSRLAPFLDGDARRALCASFLAQTIELALALAPPRQVRVATNDPAVAAMAAAHGIAVVGDRGDGPNATLAAARKAWLAEAGAAPELLVLPTDLPLATRADLRDFLGAPGDVIVAPDKTGTGTNLLLLRPPALYRIDFVFGPDSFRRYRDMAARAGLRLGVVRNERLALDIDRPEDYACWRTVAALRQGAGG